MTNMNFYHSNYILDTYLRPIWELILIYQIYMRYCFVYLMSIVELVNVKAYRWLQG